MSCHPDLFELLLFKASSAPPPTPNPPPCLSLFPPFSLALSLFPPLVSSPCRGEDTFKPSPCGRQACQGCFVGNCLSHRRCLSAHTCRPLLMPRSKRGGRALCRLNLLPDCSSVLIKQASVVFFEYSSKPSGAWLTFSPSLLHQVIAQSGRHLLEPFIRFFSPHPEPAPLFNVPKIKASLRSRGLQYRSQTQ